MSLRTSIGPLAVVAILSAAGSIGAQQPASKTKTLTITGAPSAFKSITRAEIETLVADVAEVNPAVLKRFEEDPEMKKAQLENLRQLLSLASEAERDGLAADPINKQELENVRTEVVAVNYDREINKGRKPAGPFAAIGSDRIAEYWATDSANREAKFQAFLDTKLAILKANSPDMKDRQLMPDEKEQARDYYAKTKIYEQEYNDKVSSGTLPKTLRDKVELQVKLQRAQFLARLYSEVMAAETAVTERDVETYLATHPELSSTAHRGKAEGILKRARSGEDFAKLADEFTEDPGNLSPDGKKNGGLYADVPKGRMITAFEQGALELKPGEVSSRLIETAYGFHVIKLEKAPGVAPAAQTYDVRHILISTMYKDPLKPDAQPVPVGTYVEEKLSSEKQERVMSEIIARNQVSVPDDFTVPTVTPAKTTAAKKSAPVRKRRAVTRRKGTRRR